MANARRKYQTALYAREELRDQLRRLGSKLGRVPSQLDVNRHSPDVIASAPTYQRHFGTWATALLYAGYLPESHPRADIRHADRITQYMLDNDGAVPTLADYAHNSELPSRDLVRKVFGGIAAANTVAIEQYERLSVMTGSAQALHMVDSPDAQKLHEIVAELIAGDERTYIIDDPLLLRFYDSNVRSGRPVNIVRDIWTVPVEAGTKIRRMKRSVGMTAFNLVGKCVVQCQEDRLLFSGTRMPVEQPLEFQDSGNGETPAARYTIHV